MNKKSIFFSFLLLGIFIIVIAQAGTALAADANAQATNYLLQNVKKEGDTINGNDFKFLKSNSDRASYTHASYQQYYNGVPVYGSYSLVHLNPDNTLQTLTNPEVKDYSGIPTTPTVGSSYAASVAVGYWESITSRRDVKSDGEQLVILDKSIWNDQDTSRARLAWKVDVSGQFSAGEVFVDALTGSVLYKLDRYYNAINRNIYDCSVGDIDLDGNPDCMMRYETGGNTYGRGEGDPPVGMGVNSYADTDDLYDYIGHSHNYYSTNFSIDGANRLGGYGQAPYSLPADSDGFTFIDTVVPSECPNAAFGGGQIMACEGVVASDVIYHEYQHAVTEYSITGGLIYEDESGALNEAFSDIFAVAVEYEETSALDWIIGEDVNVPGLVGPLRNMQDPTLLEYTTGAPYPDRFYSATYYCGSEDNGGVHVNSSVMNHAV
jgi:thermolysin